MSQPSFHSLAFYRNTNELFDYDNERIYCGHFNVTYEELYSYKSNNPAEKCKMKDGEDSMLLISLYGFILFDYSFEMSPKLEMY